MFMKRFIFKIFQLLPSPPYPPPPSTKTCLHSLDVFVAVQQILHYKFGKESKQQKILTDHAGVRLKFYLPVTQETGLIFIGHGHFKIKQHCTPTKPSSNCRSFGNYSSCEYISIFILFCEFL